MSEEKPKYVENCKNLSHCKKVSKTVQEKGCVGCNVWNYLYDGKALYEYCKATGKNALEFSWEIDRRYLKSTD